MKQAPSESEVLLNLTVDVILAVRAAYLANGGNALRHWEVITTRMRSSERQAQDPEEWFSLLLRGLQLEGLSKVGYRSLLELVKFVDSKRLNMLWHEVISRKYGLVIALAQNVVDEEKI